MKTAVMRNKEVELIVYSINTHIIYSVRLALLEIIYNFLNDQAHFHLRKMDVSDYTMLRRQGKGNMSQNNDYYSTYS